MSETHIEKPMCLAVIICETVIENKETNNKSYIESYSTIGGVSLPVSARLCIVASLTNIIKESNVEITLRSPSNTKILDAKGQIKSSDPLAVADIVFRLNGLPLPEFGTYHVDVLASGEHLGTRSFSVVQVQINKGPQ